MVWCEAQVVTCETIRVRKERSQIFGVGGCSSKVERLPVEQDVAGALPVSHPKEKHMNTNNLKLAIQKDGRLTDETLEFLRASGISFESYKRKLFSTCRNFPMDIIYVRDDDIPGYVESGVVDLGILGQNVLNEERPKVKKLLNLRYGYCTLTLSVPKESDITTASDLEGKTIATTYPRSTEQFFASLGVFVKTVTIRGSVEITPSLGIASAIVDLTSTGSTLTLNDLRPLIPIYRSEAVLIANENVSLNSQKQQILKQLLTRCKSVLSARDYKYIVMNAPKSAVMKVKKIMPGITVNVVSIDPSSPTTQLSGVVKEDIFWSLYERLKTLGVSNLYMLPVKNIIS